MGSPVYDFENDRSVSSAQEVGQVPVKASHQPDHQRSALRLQKDEDIGACWGGEGQAVSFSFFVKLLNPSFYYASSCLS